MTITAISGATILMLLFFVLIIFHGEITERLNINNKFLNLVMAMIFSIIFNMVAVTMVFYWKII